MNRRIKKFAAGILALVMMCMLLPGQLLLSYAATGKITFSDPSVTVGNQVSVTMKIASSNGEALGASDVMLEYDSSALEFVSGTNANGGAGSIRVLGSMESANQTTFSFTLKFKALKAGDTAIKVKSQEVYDADSRTVTIEHVGSSAVKVQAPETYSKEASLSSLTISPGSLSPEFSADVTEYTATVSGDVDKITVSAPAKDSKASVSVNGNDGLQVGENTVVCKVTAEDGTTTKTYTITVTKVEGEAPTEGTEESSEAEANAHGSGVTVTVDEGNWQVAESFDEAVLPEGFTSTEINYEGTTVQAGVDETGTVLLYMTNEAGDGDFFVYDAENGILSPYVTVRMAEKMIVVLPPEEIPEGTELPEGFVECTIDIGDYTIHGWIWKDSGETPEYCMVYGMNENGEKNFYRYDQKEMTLQRYFADPDAEELRAKYVSVVENYNSLLDDYNLRGYVIMGLFGVCILLLIIMVVLLFTRKPKGPKDAKKERYYDVDMHEDGYREKAVRQPVRKKTSGARKADPEFEDEELDILDLDEEEEEIPVRKPASNRPAPKASRSVEDVEKDIAASLAKEADQAVAAKPDEDEDDDFEFIDLDL